MDGKGVFDMKKWIGLLLAAALLALGLAACAEGNTTLDMNDSGRYDGAMSMCYVGGVIIPYMLSSLIRILMTSTGRYVILLPFVVAFTNDAGAYFIGLKFGKHKLAPVVSPNKTVEGLLGGIATAMVSTFLYALILGIGLNFQVSYGMALFYGVIGSLTGTFGDLCFSIIKRQTGIKDYGNLIPGHGGVLDRFDSLTMVAPLMEALLLAMPLVR